LLDGVSIRSVHDWPHLLSLARAGDATVLGRLLEAWRSHLVRVAERDLDTTLQGKLGASDLVQESLLDAYQHFDQFRGDSPQELRGWL
jgi:RNA polymerase sigma-70 factor (ECF subfamily)